MARSKTNLSWLTAAALISALAGSAAIAQVAAPQPHNHKPAPVNTLPPATDGVPQMVFEETHHDYGRVPDTEKIVHEFKFTNKGTGTLVIQQPTASCGCTVPFLTKREYAPGESGVIQVEYNPHGRRGDQNQRITINTNSPETPQIVLTIKAFIRTTIAFEPLSVNFGDVMMGQTAKQVVRVQGPAPDFAVTYASTNKGRYVTVRVLETRQTNIGGEDINETLLEFTFNGRAARGPFAAMSTVRTTSDKNPLADLYISAEVVGDLQVLPPRVNVGIVPTGESFHRMFRVSSRTGKPFKILGIENTSNLPQPLSIEWKPSQEGNETVWQVELRGNAPATMAPISANLTITTDQEQDKTLAVQVSGAVRPPNQPQQPAVDYFETPQPIQVAPDQTVTPLPGGQQPKPDQPEQPNPDAP